MACTAAASMTGVRTFTASSSHGLAYMHEMLHWASGSRLPIVMVNVNRAMGAPWSIWFDQSDSLSQRDTGWLQIYCATNQECLDTIIQAYRLAETILLPVMVMGLAVAATIYAKPAVQGVLLTILGILTLVVAMVLLPKAQRAYVAAHPQPPAPPLPPTATQSPADEGA